MLIEVVGLIGSSDFHAACFRANDLYEILPRKFEKPAIKSMYEFEWNEYCFNTRRELKGEYWAFNSCVISFCDKKPIGNCDALKEWAKANFAIEDYRPYTFYEMIAYDTYRDELVRRNRTYVSVVITIGGKMVGTMMMELYTELLPKTCKNFAELCKSENEKVPKNEIENYTMSYLNTIFFRCVKEGWIQGGDILYGCGDDGYSIYGPTFEDENFSVKHDRRGILSMVNRGRHTNCSQFMITLGPTRWMDFRYVAFGCLLEGWKTLEAMENVPTVNERPIYEIKIAEIKVLNGIDIHDKLR